MEIFYQKYRPAKISQLDIESVRQTLAKILSQKNIPHAFLFAGPKGVGKTSAARVLAKSLDCPKTKRGEPCSRCDVCQEIQGGESLDVIEVDAASNRGIDDIRQLKEKINLQPIKAKNKVYIVDEVHMLTREAFNAILKTLEEPPSHVYFVFCTTNPEKIPETVLSRLTRVNFPRAKKEEIIRALHRVIKGEKLKVGQEILQMIAEAADGSLRDGHKIFYQLWLEGQGRISKKAAEQVLGRWQEASPSYLFGLLAGEKNKEMILLFESLAERGVDWQDYGRRLLQGLREILLFKVKEEKPADKKMACLMEKLEKREILLLAQLISQAVEQAKTNPLPQLPFQLAGLDFLQRGEEKEKVRGDSSRFEEEKEEKEGGGKIEKRGEKKEKEPAKKTDPKEKSAPLDRASGGVDLQLVENHWQELLEIIKSMNHSVNALLRACRPRAISEENLVLEVFYQFHKDQLEQERNRRIVEEALRRLFRRSLSLKCELGERPKTAVSSSPPSYSSAKEVQEKTSSSVVGSSGNGDDLYQIAKEIFGE